MNSSVALNSSVSETRSPNKPSRIPTLTRINSKGKVLNSSQSCIRASILERETESEPIDYNPFENLTNSKIKERRPREKNSPIRIYKADSRDLNVSPGSKENLRLHS